MKTDTEIRVSYIKDLVALFAAENGLKFEDVVIVEAAGVGLHTWRCKKYDPRPAEPPPDPTIPYKNTITIVQKELAECKKSVYAWYRKCGIAKSELKKIKKILASEDNLITLLLAGKSFKDRLGVVWKILTRRNT
jgi:hypothetical protein